MIAIATLRQASRAHPRTTAALVLGAFTLSLALPLLLVGPQDLTGGTGQVDFGTLIQGIPWQALITGILLGLVSLLGWWDITLLRRPIGHHVHKALAAVVAFPLVGLLLFTVLLRTTQDTYNPLTILGLALCLNFFVALSEETLFRGVLFGALREKNSLLSAILISSVAFGSLHFLNAGLGQGLIATGYQVVNATALGVLFCALVLQGASLWPAILLHMIWNTYAMLGLAAAEFAGDIPGGPVDPFELSLSSFILPATVLFVACVMLYQYRLRTGHRIQDIVPIRPQTL